MISANRPFLLFFCVLWIIFGIAQALLGQNQIVLRINENWNPLLDLVMPYLTYLGDGVFCIVIGLMALLFSYRLGACILVSYLTSGLLVQFLKRMVYTHAFRPPVVLASQLQKMHQIPGVELLQHGSFPSGHTASAFSVFMVLALYGRSWWVQGPCLLAAIIVGFTRLYLLAHFPADVWIGALIGLGFAILTYLIAEQMAQHHANDNLDRGALRF